MLKLFAISTMLLDHIGLLFFAPTSSTYFLLRLIGRLAMPIFAYNIALGFKHTSNLFRYIKRILIMAICAQPAFICMLYDLSLIDLLSTSNFYLLFTKLNIGFTFIFGLMILNYYTLIQDTKNTRSSIYPLYIFILLLLSESCDYGLYGVLMVVIFFIALEHNYSFIRQALLLFLLTLLFFNPATLRTFQPLAYIQHFCVFSLLLISLFKSSRTLQLPRYFLYLFYPFHLYLLVFIKHLSSK